MSDQPCESTPTTPTGKTSTTGLIVRFLSQGTPESSKRLIAACSAAVLGFCAVALCEALSYQAHRNWPVSTVIAGAFALVAGYLMWLAKTLYMKPEDTQ